MSLRKKIYLNGLGVILMVFSSITVEARSYYGELKKATEGSRLYDTTNWDAKLLWKATLFTDRYRQAKIKKHLEIEHLEPPMAADYTAQELKIQEGHWEVFLGFYSKKDYHNFSLGPDSFWKVFLTTASGEKIYPDSLALVPITPYQKIMYPYLNRWSKAYRLLFPKVELGSKTTLTMQSIVGESIVKWKGLTSSKTKIAETGSIP